MAHKRKFNSETKQSINEQIKVEEAKKQEEVKESPVKEEKVKEQKPKKEKKERVKQVHQKGEIKENFLKGIVKENPILVSMLGLCPTLAITTSLENALGMGIAFIFVLTMSNVVISAIRKIVPSEIRIPIFIVIIATFVTIVEMVMSAFLPSLAASLGLFISLIVVNCVVLGRAEAYASKNTVFDSMIDAFGMGLGYTMILALVASIREFLGTGMLTVWGDFVINFNKIFGSSESLDIFSSFFISPAGAYLVLGILFGLVETFRIRKKKKQELKEKEEAEKEKQRKIQEALQNKKLNEAKEVQ